MLYMASMTSYLLIRFLFLQKVKTPMMSSKFLHLKYLDIYLVNVVQHYLSDYSCLVSFLEASPALETFILRVSYAHCTCYLSETFKSIFGDLALMLTSDRLCNIGSASFNTNWQLYCSK